MAAKNKAVDYEEIDEAEEEALLKSDDEYDTIRAKPPANLSVLTPPTATFGDEDSLMNEAAQLQAEADTTQLGKTKDQDMQFQDIDDDDDDIDAVAAAIEEEGLDADTDDESDLDETDKALQEYKQILKELEANQYVYEKYMRLCELAHATDDLDNIRNAYNRFAAVYPLSPELWLKYLSVEMNVALSSAEIAQVEQLFRKALSDYYSTDIALEFAALAPRCAEPAGIWRELLGTYGLHCMDGQQFFKLYREYISSQADMNADEQQNAYIHSFLQELKYPLYNMEESYIEFKVFYEKNKTHITHEIAWEIIDKNYFKAKEHLHKILPFEQQLKQLDAKCYRERAEVYRNYIKESDKFLDENILQTVYERMVADCCLNVECWLTYIDFIAYRDEFGRPDELQNLPLFQQQAVDVNKRALRNCTWSEKLYIKLMFLLEKLGKTREEVQEVLESSMSAGFQTAEPAVAIWMEYLTYLRRHTDWENEGECDILRKNFNLAWTILGQQWGVLADCNCEILQFWGRLEYGPLQDAKRGKELWTTVMGSSDNATRSGLWIEFAQLELRRDLEATRQLYRKALQSPGLDNPPVIASAWERFERCNGTVKTLSGCKKECTEFLSQYYAQQRKITADDSSAKQNKVKGTKRKSAETSEATLEKKIKLKVEPGKNDGVKQQKEASELQKHQETAFKEHENQEIDLTKDHLRIFLSNLDYNLTEDDIRNNLPELKIVHVDLIRSANGRSRGFGYLELESETEVEKALAMDRKILNGRPLYISSVLRDKEKRQKFKYSDAMEPKKLFLKGLPPDASKEELDQIFAAFGALTDVRLVYHKSGKFKNIAYIEFEEESAARKAVLATNQLELRGHTISVAISAPPPKLTAAPVKTINPAKLLGISSKRNNAFEQKPRMSLIPNVVRKKLNVAPPTTAATANGTSAASVKTNADFRKMLQK